MVDVGHVNGIFCGFLYLLQERSLAFKVYQFKAFVLNDCNLSVQLDLTVVGRDLFRYSWQAENFSCAVFFSKTPGLRVVFYVFLVLMPPEFE